MSELQDESEPLPTVAASNYNCVSCGYDISGTAVGGTCPECGFHVQESLAAHAFKGTQYGLPSMSYLIPILATLFCCQLTGIAAIVYTAKANTAAVTGNGRDYDSAVNARRGWIIASVAVVGIIVLIQVMLIAFGP